jgi:hypothetical protein
MPFALVSPYPGRAGTTVGPLAAVQRKPSVPKLARSFPVPTTIVPSAERPSAKALRIVGARGRISNTACARTAPHQRSSEAAASRTPIARTSASCATHPAHIGAVRIGILLDET